MISLFMMMLYCSLVTISLSFGVSSSFCITAPLRAPSFNGCQYLSSPSYSSSSTTTTSSTSWSLFSSTKESSSSSGSFTLDEKQLDFTLGYLNKHHPDLLIAFVEAFSTLGVEKAKKNAWSGGSFQIGSAKIVAINSKTMELDVVVVERNGAPRNQQVTIDLDANPISTIRSPYATMKPVPRDLNLQPIDDVIRRLCRLCWIVNKPTVTGKLVQMGIQIGGDAVGEIKENLYLNQVPHNRYVRQYFYGMAANATLEAVVLCSKGRISNRMQLISMFPEMNPSMDSYRIGTILELVRTMAIKLVEQNLRVRVCVQGSMGVGIFTGVPKQLNGVSKLLQMMDWQSGEGEENEGMVGSYLNFGLVGAEHVVNTHVSADGTEVQQDDVFIIIAPQSMVGVDSSIFGPLSEMVEAAGDRPVILINPDLTDKVSSNGQQNVRGRQERLDFANSFETIWHFQNIYVAGTSYFPILGAIFKPSPLGMWIAHQRRDLLNNDGEVYVPILAGEYKPKGDEILDAFER